MSDRAANNSAYLQFFYTSIIALTYSNCSTDFSASCITFSKANRCKCRIRRGKRDYRLLSRFHNQPDDDDDEELLDPSK